MVRDGAVGEESVVWLTEEKRDQLLKRTVTRFAMSNKCIASSNKCLTSSNKKRKEVEEVADGR